MKFIHISSVICFLLCLTIDQKLYAQSNEGTDFWFTFLEHRDRDNKRVCMISSKYDVTGVIEFSAIGWRQNVTIAANTVQIFSIPAEAEMLSSETVDYTSVRVSTSGPASVYIHQYNQMRSDASLVLPVTALGKEYYIMSYSPYMTNGELFPSEYALVAIEDNTKIDILSSAASRKGMTPGGSKTLMLNKGETYQVHGASINDDLTGTAINSTKPLAVFSGNRWVQVPNGCGNRDNLLEQMPPVDSWGREFVLVPSKNTSNDIFRIISAVDNTLVEMYNKGQQLYQSFTLNRGEWKELRLDHNARYVKTSNAILLAQFLVGGDCNGNNRIGDPSMVILNSLEQYRDTVTLYNSPFEIITDNFINVTMKSQDTSTFRLDNRPLSFYNSNFQTIGENDEFAYAQIEVVDGPHTLIGGGCGVIAIAYGYGFAESYAYGGGANFTKINNLPLPDGACLNDSILFESGLPKDKFAVLWDFGNGNSSTQHNVKQIYRQSGTYLVKLKFTNLCLNKTDSTQKTFVVSLRNDLLARGDTTICTGGDLYLYASDTPGSKFIWKGPDQFTSNDANPILFNVNSKQSGEYEVIGVLDGCASSAEYIRVEVIENPKPDLGRDTFLCFEKESIILNSGSFLNPIWQDGSRGFEYEVKKEGLYTIAIEDENGCPGYDSIYVADICPVTLYVPNAFSPNGDHINDFFKAEIKHYTAFQLEIFDRWGELLFRSTDPQSGWNGRFDDQPMMPGVYVYSIKYSGYDEKLTFHQKIKAGDFTLIR